jgi:hypothetical protein
MDGMSDARGTLQGQVVQMHLVFTSDVEDLTSVIHHLEHKDCDTVKQFSTYCKNTRKPEI